MKTNVFQWIVILTLGVVLILSAVALMKKQDPQTGAVKLGAFGKTLWSEKDKTNEVKKAA